MFIKGIVDLIFVCLFGVVIKNSFIINFFIVFFNVFNFFKGLNWYFKNVLGFL